MCARRLLDKSNHSSVTNTSRSDATSDIDRCSRPERLIYPLVLRMKTVNYRFRLMVVFCILGAVTTTTTRGVAGSTALADDNSLNPTGLGRNVAKATAESVNTTAHAATFNCEIEILRLDFENGVLDPSTTRLTTMGSFGTPPGIKPSTSFPSKRAFGFGRSTCPTGCLLNYIVTLRIVLPTPTFVSTLSFKEMEQVSNWGSQGGVFIDGRALNGNPSDDFGRLPHNDLRADSTFRTKLFQINRSLTNIEFRVWDITKESEIFIDDIVINAASSTAPTLVTQPQSQTVRAGTDVTFNVAASSAVPVSYQWLFNKTNLPGAIGDRLFIAKAQLANAGNYSVIAGNCSGTVTSQVVTLTVDVPNLPPALTALPPQRIDESTPLIFLVHAADFNTPAQILTYSLAAGAPIGAAIDPQSGLFSWTPFETQGPGAYPITVIVADNGVPSLSATNQFQVAVAEVNQPPVVEAIANQTIKQGDSLTAAAQASDPDIPGNILTFSLEAGAPTGASIDAVTGVFSWTPTGAQAPSTNTITVRVTDNGSPSFSATTSFTAIVNASAEGLSRPLLNLLLLATGQYALELTGETGRNCRIQTSTDLRNWMDLTNTSNAILVVPLPSPVEADSRQRFYRAVSP
jgi:hypothetical protein